MMKIPSHEELRQWDENSMKRWWIYMSGSLQSQYLKYARERFAEECEIAIEHEIDNLSGLIDENDYVGLQGLDDAFRNIMKIVRGER